jgi:hypothetical protein
MRDRIVCGDTLDFVTTLVGYPAATWTCTYYFVPRAGGSGSAFSVVCTAGTKPDEHRCAAAASTTALWTPAEYSWFVRVTSGSETYSGDAWPWRGECTLLPNPATTTNYDSRSHARKVLDAIEAVLEGKAGADVAEYTIGGRSLSKYKPEELLVWRDKYKAEVWREDAAAKMAQGMGNPRAVYVRFGRV